MSTFGPFVVGVVASTYMTLCLADQVGKRTDLVTFPRRSTESTSSKDYEQVLRDRVYKAKYKHERQEVTQIREAYNETIKSAKDAAETMFGAIEDQTAEIKKMFK